MLYVMFYQQSLAGEYQEDFMAQLVKHLTGITEVMGQGLKG